MVPIQHKEAELEQKQAKLLNKTEIRMEQRKLTAW
jgi:hypothetical protein